MYHGMRHGNHSSYRHYFISELHFNFVANSVFARSPLKVFQVGIFGVS